MHSYFTSITHRYDSKIFYSIPGGIQGLTQYLSSLIQWVAAMSTAGGWNLMVFKVPSNPIHSVSLLQITPHTHSLRTNFSLSRVVRCWHKLPGEVVDALSVAVFKARLDGALGNLV